MTYDDSKFAGFSPRGNTCLDFQLFNPFILFQAYNYAKELISQCPLFQYNFCKLEGLVSEETCTT